MSNVSSFSYRSVFHLCVLILFTELLLVRWVSTELSLLAYLQNSVLVICFLGLGMGLMSPRKHAQVSDVIPPLSILIVLLSLPMTSKVLASIAITLNRFHDFTVWGVDAQRYGLVGTHIILALAIVLLVARVIWSIMVTLGSVLGARLQSAPDALKGYSSDISGSLVGALLFGALGFFALPPFYWVCLLIALILIDPSTRNVRSLAFLSVALLALGVGYSSEKFSETYWTPYQKLGFSRAFANGEWIVETNNSGYQQIQDNSAAAMQLDPQLASFRGINQYDIPSRLYTGAQNIVILGAGTGNDVAGALRNTSGRITAVEVDRKILELGNKYHPEKPYESPRLNIVVDDARAAIQSFAPKSVDLLILGLLDSHTTPNLSAARLDNFVYTTQSFERMRTILKDDGVFVLIFNPQRPYIAARLQNGMASAFKLPIKTVDIPGSTAGWGGMMFITGDPQRIESSLRQNPDLAAFLEHNAITEPPDKSVRPTTDSWPYLYVEKRSIPALFWMLGGGILVLWIISSIELTGRVRGPNIFRRDDLHFLSLGAGFSLVQTFSIYKESVLFGATWIVTTIVVAGTLLMILVANWLVPRIAHISSRLVSLLLITVCIIGALLPPEIFLEMPMAYRITSAALVSGLPMLLSGIIFARSFATATNRGGVLGVNLFGALIGGLLQYSTFLTGIPFVMILGTLFYVVASLSLPKINAVGA